MDLTGGPELDSSPEDRENWEKGNEHLGLCKMGMSCVGG
jgi:hypothetical protein